MEREYRKQIGLTSTGMVMVSVYFCKNGEDIECIGRNNYSGGVFSHDREKSLIKAHNWADGTIKLAEKYEERK